jgi:hypothetical protein
VRDVIDGHQRFPNDWLKTWQMIQDKWGEVDLCPEGYNKPFNIDAKLNGAYIVLGMLYGGGDFEKTMEISTRCGQDADCNPSNAVGVIGTILGYKRIPAQYTDYDFPQLIEACERVTRQVLAKNGGRVVTRNGQEVMEFPLQKPQPPKKLEQVTDFSLKELFTWGDEYQIRRLQVAVPGGWGGGWKVRALGPDMDPGVRTAMGREDVLMLHPIDRARPATMERTVTVPARGAKLRLTVAAHPDSPSSDWELRVFAGDQLLHKRVIADPGKWQDVEVDLSAYAGKQVLLRIENAAGGKHDWQWEAGYFARAELVEERE